VRRVIFLSGFLKDRVTGGDKAMGHPMIANQLERLDKRLFPVRPDQRLLATE